jgi:hypothetical protein
MQAKVIAEESKTLNPSRDLKRENRIAPLAAPRLLSEAAVAPKIRESARRPRRASL